MTTLDPIGDGNEMLPARYVLHNLAFRCRTLKEAIAEAEELRKATGAEFGIFELRERVVKTEAPKREVNGGQ